MIIVVLVCIKLHVFYSKENLIFYGKFSYRIIVESLIIGMHLNNCINLPVSIRTQSLIV